MTNHYLGITISKNGFDLDNHFNVSVISVSNETLEWDWDTKRKFKIGIDNNLNISNLTFMLLKTLITTNWIVNNLVSSHFMGHVNQYSWGYLIPWHVLYVIALTCLLKCAGF